MHHNAIVIDPENYLGMNEIEIRKFCLENSLTILSWYKSYFPRKDLNPIVLADIIYQYITKGIITEFELPGTIRSRENNGN